MSNYLERSHTSNIGDPNRIQEEIAIELARIERERQISKQLAEKIGITAKMSESQTLMIPGDTPQEILRVERSSGWYRSTITVDCQTPEFNLRRAKACVGDYYEEIQIVRDAPDGGTQVLRGLMFYVGPERSRNGLWVVSHTIYEGPLLSDRSVVEQRRFVFNPNDPNSMAKAKLNPVTLLAITK